MPRTKDRPPHRITMLSWLFSSMYLIWDDPIGVLKYSFLMLIAYAYGIWMSLSIVPRLLLHGHSILRTRDWSTVVLPSPVPNVYHQKIDVGNNIWIDVVHTAENSASSSQTQPPSKHEKPVMLLVHGFPEAWYSWRHQMQYFRDQYHVVAMSLRGYGDSSRPPQQAKYAMTELMQDVIGVLRAINNGNPATILSHDWGGAICWNVAQQHPELIDRLVIACAPHPRCFARNLNLNQFFKSWYMFFFQVPYVPELFLSLSDYKAIDDAFRTIKNEDALTQTDIDMYKKDLSRPGALTAALNYYRELARSLSFTRGRGLGHGRTRRHKSSKISVPTLVIWADQDMALGMQMLRGIEKYVERSLLRIEILRDCSHWCQQDRAEDFNRIVDNFLTSS